MEIKQQNYSISPSKFSSQINNQKYLDIFDTKKKIIIDNLEPAHRKFYESAGFSGPSLYFHEKSLESAKSKDLVCFSEYVYAALVSWGMHRMGPGGSKMCGYQDFFDSLEKIWPQALELQNKKPSDLNENDWNNLKEVFMGIRCMASRTSLVGNSKVMAHLIPNLIPPVDRQYTLSFLYRNKNLKNDKEQEWNRLLDIIENFFYPITEAIEFSSKATKWSTSPEQFPWDTSPLKIIDNVLIGYVWMLKES